MECYLVCIAVEKAYQYWVCIFYFEANIFDFEILLEVKRHLNHFYGLAHSVLGLIILIN
jgi:hypothetical protein